MGIDNLHSSHARPGSDLFEHKLLRIRQLQKGQVLRRRANKDEIVVLRIVERKQAPSLHANWLAKFLENIIERMDGQNFTDSRIVVQNHGSGILGTIVITH